MNLEYDGTGPGTIVHGCEAGKRKAELTKRLEWLYASPHD